MQLIARLTDNSILRRLALAAMVALLALTTLAIGQSLSGSAADRGVAAHGGGGVKVLAAVPRPEGDSGIKPRA
jgi:hypothetical protein